MLKLMSETVLTRRIFFQTGALLLDGDTIQYFGATVPVNLAAAVIAEIVLVGGAEYYRSTNKSPLGSVCAPSP
jgi:light-harvesting complex II chlorophyll a/b binding protein 5